jgi:hypothetical protein
MAEVVNDFYSELNDVLSKVNTWALGREKELLSLQAEHTSFLDTHNGRDRRKGAHARHLRAVACPVIPWPQRAMLVLVGRVRSAVRHV